MLNQTQTGGEGSTQPQKGYSVYKCKASGGQPVNYERCQGITRVPARNAQGCTNCACVWRLCRVCVLQGATDLAARAINPASGLCKFHTEKGERAQRPMSAPANPKPSAPANLTKPRAVLEQPAPALVESAEEGKALLERVRVAISSAEYHKAVPIERIRAMVGQPRKHFNPERLLQLGDSIKTVGQLMPGYLRKVELDTEGRDFELVDGDRRWQSMIVVGVPTFRAMVVDIDDFAAQYLISVISNFNREGHTILEIADSICVLHEQLKLTIKDIAESNGMHPVRVTNLYGLRRLDPAVRAMLDPEVATNARQKLPEGAAIQLSRLPTEHQLPLAQRILKRDITLNTLREEVVSVSKKYDLPIQQRTINPGKQRERIGEKVGVVARDSADLKKRIEATPRPALLGWALGAAMGYRGQLLSARDNLNGIIKILDDIVRRKQN